MDSVQSLINDPGVQKEAEELIGFAPQTTIDILSQRIESCFTKYDVVLVDDDFLPGEMDSATRALTKCICRELNRLKMANGNNLPTKTLNEMWNGYGCKDNLN